MLGFGLLSFQPIVVGYVSSTQLASGFRMPLIATHMQARRAKHVLTN